MASTDKQKQSLYFPEDVLREIVKESNRLDRSLSWTVQQAWRVARAEVRKLPSVGNRTQAEPEGRGSDEPGGAARHVQASPQVREFLRGKFDRDENVDGALTDSTRRQAS